MVTQGLAASKSETQSDGKKGPTIDIGFEEQPATVLLLDAQLPAERPATPHIGPPIVCDLALDARAGARIERKIANDGWAYVGGGWAFGRELRIEEEDSGRLLLESDVDGGAFFAVGLSFGF